MKKSRGEREDRMNVQSTPAVRESIIFPPVLYETLAEIAMQGKVSLAWVARDAAAGGWDQVRSRLIGTAKINDVTRAIDWSEGRPMLFVFSTCKALIRTLPALQHDPSRAEDVDTEQEDHAPDETRYACMSRPYVTKKPDPERTRQDAYRDHDSGYRELDGMTM